MLRLFSVDFIEANFRSAPKLTCIARKLDEEKAAPLSRFVQILISKAQNFGDTRLEWFENSIEASNELILLAG